ncbi:uncharacterized protein PV06_03271 [Exophiala oligosperma]|uniref:Uncharacterized protein n=1 Tax=Exophiala oligosperma TaxID=215243 RepID=A0A0D2C4W0_9EURO|nr:uncharacterized protein PV06_03271 [Exophiala oligosperma]KIW44827.1 hypothetical protein PV06_03271 [Exophiala oligosperma]
MSSVGDDRGYKVVYTSRKKDSDRVDHHRPRRDYEYPEERVARRDYRDERVEIDRSSRSDFDAGSTRTTYKVGRDRKSEAYLKRNDAIVIENPRDYGRAEYEVVRPTRNADGAYVIDLGGGGRPRGRDDREAKYYDVDYRSRRGDDVVMYDSRGRDRVVKDTVYKDVQVIEDYDDGPRSDRRGRRTVGSYEEEDEVPPPPRRLRSAMRGRNDSPPEVWEHKRSRSRVGFYRDQVSLHDASESRHERPGAEAHLAGKYLVGHRGQRVRDDEYDDDDDHRSGRHRRRYAPQRMSEPRITGQEEYDDDKRTFTEDVMRSYEYEDDAPPRRAYPPQRSRSRRRHSRRRHADDYSDYSEHEVRKRTEEYY